MNSESRSLAYQAVEASFMLKNNYLSEKDFKGSRRYLTADGSIANGAPVRIKEVKVGEATLKNIDASVLNSQKAPLLLGQSALERFGIHNHTPSGSYTSLLKLAKCSQDVANLEKQSAPHVCERPI